MRIGLVFVALLFLYSCQELTGEKPLSPVRKSTIDTTNIGLWKFISSKSYNQFELKNDSHLLSVLPFNEHEYLLIIYPLSDSSGKNDISFFKAHTSNICGNKIANLQMITEKLLSDYIYYAFKNQNDTLYFWGFYSEKVSRDINSKKEIKSFLSKHINDSNYFSAVRKYVRIKSKDFLPNKP